MGKKYSPFFVFFFLKRLKYSKYFVSLIQLKTKTQIQKMTTIVKIKKNEAYQLLLSELKIATSLRLGSGWRIPIYIDGFTPINGEVECQLSSGGWISDSNWQPDAIEVLKIKPWDVDYDLDDEASMKMDDWDWQSEIEECLNIKIQEQLIVVKLE